jgi:hypothetical protein
MSEIDSIRVNMSDLSEIRLPDLLLTPEHRAIGLKLHFLSNVVILALNGTGVARWPNSKQLNGEEIRLQADRFLPRDLLPEMTGRIEFKGK